jgi:hypothetical protein
MDFEQPSNEGAKVEVLYLPLSGTIRLDFCEFIGIFEDLRLAIYDLRAPLGKGALDCLGGASSWHSSRRALQSSAMAEGAVAGGGRAWSRIFQTCSATVLLA